MDTGLAIRVLKADEDNRRFISANSITAYAGGVIGGINDALKQISKRHYDMLEVVVVVSFGLPLALCNLDLGVPHG